MYAIQIFFQKLIQYTYFTLEDIRVIYGLKLTHPTQPYRLFEKDNGILVCGANNIHMI